MFLFWLIGIILVLEIRINAGKSDIWFEWFSQDEVRILIMHEYFDPWSKWYRETVEVAMLNLAHCPNNQIMYE